MSKNTFLSSFCSVRAKNGPINGSISKEKGINLIRVLKKKYCYANIGWLQHFKDRHATVLKIVNKESAQVKKNCNRKKMLIWKENVFKQFKKIEYLQC